MVFVRKIDDEKNKIGKILSCQISIFRTFHNIENVVLKICPIDRYLRFFKEFWNYFKREKFELLFKNQKQVSKDNVLKLGVKATLLEKS